MEENAAMNSVIPATILTDPVKKEHEISNEPLLPKMTSYPTVRTDVTVAFGSWS